MSGYPQDLLSNRSVVKNDFAIITPQGRVINTIPGIVDAKMTILCSPKIGAGFVQLIGTLGPMPERSIPMRRSRMKSPSFMCWTGKLSWKRMWPAKKRI